jgi:hypothetical protein
VDRFLAAAEGVGDLWAARGQCVEHYGSGEAYLPVLEALGQPCGRPGGEQMIALSAAALRPGWRRCPG